MATIRSLLRDRVSLQVRSVDRIDLQAYVPGLMSEGLLVRFLLDRGFTIPSPALLGRNGRRYVTAIERFAAQNGIPIVRSARVSRRRRSPVLTSRLPSARGASAAS